MTFTRKESGADEEQERPLAATTHSRYTQEVLLLPATSAPEENSDALFNCLHIRTYVRTYVVADSLELSLIIPIRQQFCQCSQYPYFLDAP